MEDDVVVPLVVLAGKTIENRNLPPVGRDIEGFHLDHFVARCSLRPGRDWHRQDQS